jgi:hypothetical protein
MFCDSRSWSSEAGVQVFIRRGDGDEDLQRASEGVGRLALKVDRPAQHHHGRLQRQHPAVRQARGFERQAEQFGGVRLPADFHRRPGELAAAVDEIGDGGGRIAREAQRGQFTAKLRHLCLL